MSNMRIRNMFLFVTALAVMFLLACGSSEYDKAIDDYTKTIELNPDDDEIYFQRGVAYSNLEQYDKAIDDFTKTIELNPDSAGTYNNRSNAYSNLQQYDKVLKD